MERNKRTAIVIGGGVAGPLVALALRRVGLEVVVVDERAPDAVSTQGAWLTVAVNGLDAMGTLGVQHEVKAAGFPSRVIELTSGSGEILGAVPLGGQLEDGTVTHTIRRRDLCSVLHRAAERAGARLEHGRRLLAIDEDEHGVTARFDSGTPLSGDMLIGADGIGSTVRRWIDPGAPVPRYGGLGDVGGFTPRAALPDPEHADFDVGTYRMMFGARAFFGYTVAPDGDVWWFANPAWRDREELAILRAMSEPARRETLAALFDRDVGPMRALITHASGPVIATLQNDLPRVPRWSKGRVVILGDAAHAAKPSSGQGVSMAAEDAVELGRCVRDLPDVPGAFRRFEELRRARAEAVVTYGARNASGKAAGPIAAKIRDAMLPMILRRVAATHGRSLAWLFGHHIAWDASVARTDASAVTRRSSTRVSVALLSVAVFLVYLRYAGLMP